jgi:multiple sugar transport system permease protein
MSSRAVRLRRGSAHAVRITLLLFTLLPVLWLLQMSFKTGVDAFRMPPLLLFTPTFENYLGLLQERFPKFFMNSVVVSLTTTALSMLLGVPAAYAMARARFRGTGGLRLWILFTRMVPPIAVALPFFLMFRTAGLLDTRLGLVIVYLTFNLGLVVWTMEVFFAGIPPSLEEAARIDGASVLRIFLKVSLPLSAPGLATTAILCFLFSWNDFFFALVLTRTQAMTAPVGIINFLNYEGWEWGKIAAGGTVVMLPVILFALLVRRYLISGLLSGAVRE